ncbi:MAG: glycosyltransferase family 39 protein [Actinomycetota bacterium]|nr:glycosyltransferase family 39 protein [Actinomycetota bacterium]
MMEKPKDKITNFSNALWPVKIEHVLVSLLTIAVYLALVVFRRFDDNRLTSWQWVFDSINPHKILLLIILGVIIAYVLSRTSFPKRYPLPFLFTLSSTVSILFWQEPELIVDASRYFTQAKHLELYGIAYFIKEWGRNIIAWTDLPLVPFIFGLIFKFFGESRLYIQAFTTLLFSSTVLLTYLIGKTLWDEDTGFFGGLSMLGIPYIFTQVPLMLVDVPTMFFFTLAVYTFIRALEPGGTRAIVVANIAIFMAFFSKYSTWLMFSLLAIILLVYFFNAREKENKSFGKPSFFSSTNQRAVLLQAFVIVLASVFLIVLVIFLKFDVFFEQIRFLKEYQEPGLKRWGESFLSTFFFQIHPFLTISALCSAYAAFKKRDLKYLIISWLILLVFLLEIKRIRYTVIAFPMFSLMAAYGLQMIKSRNLRTFVALCAVTSSLAISIFAYLPFLQGISVINLKRAGEYLNSAGEKNIEVITLPFKDFPDCNPAVSVPLLDIFTDRNIAYRYKHSPPPFDKIRTSSLRFTWAYKNPEYYNPNKHTYNPNKHTATKDVTKDVTIVIIAGSADETLPGTAIQKLKGYHLSKVFKSSSGIFRYQTIVKIYQPTL